MTGFTAVRFKAITIAIETQGNKLEQTGVRIKSIWEELSPIGEITSDEMLAKVDSLLKEYDVLKGEFDLYLQDLNDFIELIEHEFDLITEPLNTEITRVEKLIKDYRENVRSINKEIARRYH